MTEPTAPPEPPRPCPECGEELSPTRAYQYPDGDVLVLPAHGSGDDVVSCDGSLTVVDEQEATS